MADLTIKATENMIGSGHPTLTDTLNRLALVQHGTDGTHVDVTVSGTFVQSLATDSSSSTTGAIKTAGGMGIAKKLFVGDTLAVTGAATLASITTGTAITKPTITNYIETLYSPAAGSAFTVDLTNGTIQKFTTNANITISLPASVAGACYTVIIAYGGTHTLTWAGGGTIKWANGAAPIGSSTSGKFDMFSFICDGTNTYGCSRGLGY